MDQVNLADAKARLSAIIDRIEAGESIEITRRGKAVARLSPILQPKKKIDMEALKALDRLGPPQTESAGDFIRRMRDEDRY